MTRSAQKSFDALVGFGANQGDIEGTLRRVEQAFADHPEILEWNCSSLATTTAVSGLSKSGASDESTQDDYANAALWLRTALSVAALFDWLQELEQQLGRQRGEKWGPRSVDLDLLLFGDTQLESERLTVPHRQMSLRRFVLEPAIEIAPEMIHPVSGMTLRQLLEHINNSQPVIVVVTDDLALLQSLISDLPFEVSVIDNQLDFIRLAGQARLVVSVFDKSDASSLDRETSSLIRYAENFAGPTLRIDRGAGATDIVRELRAAHEAMQ